MTIDDELRAAKAALAEALGELERARELRAKLSHRLRTPLSAIVGWAELLLARPTTQGETRRGLDTIARNARAQAQLIEELLDGERPTQPMAPIEIAPARPPVAHAQPNAKSEAPLSGVKVLVIDDELDALALLVHILSDAGAGVVAAASSEEALAKLAEHRPDVIVSDIGMPDRDGYQLMRSIRIMSPERGGRTPAVALTGFARSEDRTRALLAGYQVHLTKPIEPLELVVTLASLAGRA